MQRWIVFLIPSFLLLAACSPDLPVTPAPTTTPTPPGLSQQLNQFATQTQAAALTTTAGAEQSADQVPIDSGLPTLVTPLPLPIETAGPFQQVSRQEALIAGNVRELLVIDDRVLLVSENGISEFEDGEWAGYFTGETGYPVGIDVTDRAWIAKPDGSHIFRSEPNVWRVRDASDDTEVWLTFQGWTPASSELGSPVRYGLLTDSRGDLWLATGNDVRSFNGAWNVHDSQTMGMPEIASDTYGEFTILPVQRNGEVLVGRCDWGSAGPQGGGGVRSFDGQAWRELAEELNTGCLTAIVEDSSGDLWLALDESLYHFDRAGATWDKIDLPSAPPQTSFGYITGLTADPLNGVWVQLALCEPEGCFGGEMLYRLTNGEWQPIGEPSQAGGRRVLFDSSEAPWLLAAGEISQIISNSLQPVSGLAVMAATNDQAGNLWLLAQSNGPPTIWSER